MLVVVFGLLLIVVVCCVSCGVLSFVECLVVFGCFPCFRGRQLLRVDVFVVVGDVW